MLQESGGSTYLEDVGPVDETHEGEESSVGPAVDGHTTQVHKLVLVSHVLQPLHLVLNLHLALNRSHVKRNR